MFIPNILTIFLFSLISTSILRGAETSDIIYAKTNYLGRVINATRKPLTTNYLHKFVDTLAKNKGHTNIFIAMRESIQVLEFNVKEQNGDEIVTLAIPEFKDTRFNILDCTSDSKNMLLVAYTSMGEFNVIDVKKPAENHADFKYEVQFVRQIDKTAIGVNAKFKAVNNNVELLLYIGKDNGRKYIRQNKQWQEVK